MSAFRGLTLGKLAKKLGRGVRQLEGLASRGDSQYRLVSIRIGSKTRTLAIPAPTLMATQRDLLSKVFYEMPAHECLGHVRRRGVIWTLRRHQRHPNLFHADIKDFFPSVTRTRVEGALLRLQVAPDAANVISRLVTRAAELPQGAPTSVAVGDMVLYCLDQRIAGLAKKGGLTFSRYVDDLTLSGNGGALKRFSQLAVRSLREDGWSLSSKGGLYGPDESHRILNAIVNQKPNVTRAYYQRVRDSLRGIARFGHRPIAGEMDSLASQVIWIATVNPSRRASLVLLLEEALQATTRRASDSGPEAFYVAPADGLMLSTLM